MIKEQIINEINRVQKRLANLKKQLDECEYGYRRWEPEIGETYWVSDTVCGAYDTVFTKDELDYRRIKSYNCFKNRKEAKTETEKILVRRMLEDIARKLNKGEKIDWYNSEQPKHCIELYCNNIVTNFYFAHKTQGAVYCLDINFDKIAIQEIGEERLKKYLRG